MKTFRGDAQRIDRLAKREARPQTNSGRRPPTPRPKDRGIKTALCLMLCLILTPRPSQASSLPPFLKDAVWMEVQWEILNGIDNDVLFPLYDPFVETDQIPLSKEKINPWLALNRRIENDTRNRPALWSPDLQPVTQIFLQRVKEQRDFLNSGAYTRDQAAAYIKRYNELRSQFFDKYADLFKDIIPAVPDDFGVKDLIERQVSLADTDEDRRSYREALRAVRDGRILQALRQLYALFLKYGGRPIPTESWRAVYETALDHDDQYEMLKMIHDGTKEQFSTHRNHPFAEVVLHTILSLIVKDAPAEPRAPHVPPSETERRLLFLPWQDKSHIIAEWQRLLDQQRYLPYLADMFVMWRAHFQTLYCGYSRYSLVPFQIYQAERWQALETVLDHLEDHPDDVIAWGDLLSLMETPIISRISPNLPGNTALIDVWSYNLQTMLKDVEF